MRIFEHNAMSRPFRTRVPRASRCRMEWTIRLIHQGTTMHPSPPSPSPLDEELRLFLRHVREIESGFSPGRQSGDVAEILDIPEAFVEALFTSARTRGLLKPIPLGRGRLRWTVSATGERFLEGAANTATASSA